MNDELQRFARQTLKAGLDKLPESNQRVFKLMYALPQVKHQHRKVEDIEAVPIHQAVDDMPAERLDWAMQQVEASLKKLNLL